MLTAATLRLGLMAAALARTGTRIMTQGDTASYLEPGRNLLLHGIYANAGVPEIDRAPGYPIFAMCSGMLSENVVLTVVIQIVISLLSLLLVRTIAERTFPGKRGGLTAAWLYAIEPVSILYAVRVMPETVFVLLLLVVIERFMAYQSRGKMTALFAAGMALAAATYVRPVSYYLVFPLALWLVIVTPTPNGWATPRPKGWVAAAVLLTSVLPWLTAWQIRNRIETGYGGFSSIVEKNLYFYQSAEVTAELRKTSLADEQKRLGYPDEASYIAVHPEQRDWIQWRRLQFMKAQSMAIIAEHPALYLRTHFTGVGVVALTPCAAELLQMLNAYPPGGDMPARVVNEGLGPSVRRILSEHAKVAIVMALMEGFLLLLYLLAAGGISGKRGDRQHVFLLIAIGLYFLLISGGAQAVGRYRVPVVPELCVLAAGGLVTIAERNRRGWRASPVAAELEVVRS
jgi:4-amino-4-deoxy-L-arabinose transferase-like glycosyltransferase